MGNGTYRLRRTTAAVAMAALVGLTAACGSTTDTGAPAGAGTGTKAPATGAKPAPAAGDVSDQGMKDGCTAVHQLLVALDAGDRTTAQSLKDKGKAMFDGVVKAATPNDPQLASNATAMSEMLGFDLPAKPIFQSSLAETYTVDCVAQYGAAALPA
jgi:hypothetical protein